MANKTVKCIKGTLEDNTPIRVLRDVNGDFIEWGIYNGMFTSIK